MTRARVVCDLDEDGAIGKVRSASRSSEGPVEEVRARTVSTGYGQKLWVPLIVKRPEIVTTVVTKIE